jgi:hypothetical protein
VIVDASELPTDTITHIAGPRMDMAGRIIQRCVVCGQKLADSQNRMELANPDGNVSTFPTWEPGALVQIESGNPTRYSVIEDDGGKIGPDYCINWE